MKAKEKGNDITFGPCSRECGWKGQILSIRREKKLRGQRKGDLKSEEEADQAFGEKDWKRGQASPPSPFYHAEFRIRKN